MALQEGFAEGRSHQGTANLDRLKTLSGIAKGRINFHNVDGNDASRLVHGFTNKMALSKR
jgi:hypothetical protein